MNKIELAREILGLTKVKPRLGPSYLLFAKAEKLAQAVIEDESDIDRLRGSLQNCVNLLHRLKRHGYAQDVTIADKAIDSANKVLYETLVGKPITPPEDS